MLTVLIGLLLGLFLRFVVGLCFLKVSGNSMKPTYRNGGLLLGLAPRKIKRFDVIVFKRDKKMYLKRVVALPQERVELKDGYVLINHLPLAEPYLSVNQLPRLQKTLRQDVPSNHYFVLGDNRKSSVDSRKFGVIAKEEVLAKVCWRIK